MPKDEIQETIDRGEYGVIVCVGCTIQITPLRQRTLSQYDGQKSGVCFGGDSATARAAYQDFLTL